MKESLKSKESYRLLLKSALHHWYVDQCHFPYDDARHYAEQVTEYMITENKTINITRNKE